MDRTGVELSESPVAHARVGGACIDASTAANIEAARRRRQGC